MGFSYKTFLVTTGIKKFDGVSFPYLAREHVELLALVVEEIR